MDTKDLLKERAKTHGPFSQHSIYAQQLKAIGADVKMSAVQREALDMIYHKIARILNGNPDYADHWADIAGYAQLVVNDLTPKESPTRAFPLENHIDDKPKMKPAYNGDDE